MIKSMLLISILMFSGLAQSNVLDLKEIVRISIEHNPKIIAAKEKISQFEAQTGLSKSALYPNLSWTLGGSYLKDAVYTGSPKFNGEAYNQYSSDLKLNQVLYAKGLYSAVNLSDFDKKIQSVNVEILERDLTRGIISAFYRFILNQQALENLLKNQSIIQRALSISTQRYNKGRGQLLDILQVKTRLALILPQLEQARNELAIAGQELINFMGEKEHPDLKIKGLLKTVLLKDVKKYIDLKNFRLPEYELNQLQLTQLDYGRDVVLGKNYPTVKLVGDYLYNNYKKAELFSDYSHGWSVQLQLVVPLFSGLSSNSERAIFNSQESQIKIARRDLENSLNLKQITSIRNLESTEASLLSAESAVKLSEETQAESERLYRLSQIDFLQFLTVEQAALEARSGLDQLKYKSILAYADYFVATGQPLHVLINILSENGGRQ